MNSSRTIAFVHQNIPGQFRNLAPAIADSGCRVFFITNGQGESRGTTKVHYKIDKGDDAPHIVQIQYAQRAARALLHVRDKLGVVPDLVIGHVSWGELMFMKDLFPKTPLIGYFEWFHRVEHFSGFPEFDQNPNGAFVYRVKNLSNYISHDICDKGITPTWWQYASYPESLQAKLNVIHDGVDTVNIRRPDKAGLQIPDGPLLTEADEVVTYVARSLEPVRGFPQILRAASELCRRRPNCHVVIVGQDGTTYGNPLPAGESHKDRVSREIELDPSRVHFLGRIPYRSFLQTLYISSVHVYLTFPFFLSWSMLEAMAAECLVIGSRTPPVEEVIVDGHNGLLVDFHDHHALADRICAVLEKPRDYDPIRREARRTILERYDLHGICLPRQKALINSLL